MILKWLVSFRNIFIKDVLRSIEEKDNLIKEHKSTINFLLGESGKLKQKLKEYDLTLENMEVKFNDSYLRLNTANSKLKESQKILESSKQFVQEIIEGGMDDDLECGRYNDSWAVFCLHGKTDYVKFVDMSSYNVSELSSFFRKFEYSNISIDTTRPYIYDGIFKINNKDKKEE